MKKRIIFILCTILCCSISAFAQTKPVWVTSLENSIKQKETKWKIEKTNGYGENNNWNAHIILKSGQNSLAIQITQINAPNLKESFEGLVKSFGDTIGKNNSKLRLANYGDEGYIWANLNKSGWTMIYFRKNKIIVNVYAPTSATAKRFAGYVLKEIPDKL